MGESESGELCCFTFLREFWTVVQFPLFSFSRWRAISPFELSEVLSELEQLLVDISEWNRLRVGVTPVLACKAGRWELVNTRSTMVLVIVSGPERQK